MDEHNTFSEKLFKLGQCAQFLSDLDLASFYDIFEEGPSSSLQPPRWIMSK